jgi:voltage-gated potassium channel
MTVVRTAREPGLVRRYRTPLALFAGAVAYGVAGYMLLLGWSFREAVYMTAITLSTVGYREVQPLGPGGEVFTISLLLFGLVTVFAFLGSTTEVIITGQLQRSVRRARLRHDIGHLRNHYVVCGFGRVGRAAVAEFRAQGAGVVVVDRDEAVGDDLRELGVPHLIDDATREVTLRQAGLERARGLVCALDSDALNVYVALTARSLRSDLVIVARACDPESVDRLQRAGADRVIQPYALSGRLLASLSIRPAVVDFLDLVQVAPDLRLEEVEVRGGGRLDGVESGEVARVFPGVTVLALRAQGETGMLPSPPAAHRLTSGDLIVALGPVASLQDLAA